MFTVVALALESMLAFSADASLRGFINARRVLVLCGCVDKIFFEIHLLRSLKGQFVAVTPNSLSVPPNLGRRSSTTDQTTNLATTPSAV